MVTGADLAPIGQIVVIGVGNPSELAGGGGEIDGVDRAAPGVPAARRLAHHLGVQADGFGNLGGLDFRGHVAVIDPFQPVRGYFPAGSLHGRDLFGVAGKGGGDAVDGEGQLKAGEQAVQTPETGARAIIVERFHVPVPLIGPRGGPGDVGQERFGLGIAVQDVVLAALLVVQHH